LPGADGYIDTGDLVEKHDGRYYFMGRREGVINVGGRKVYPEEVENVITQHPDVLMARVWPRKNPIMGAIVAADVVLRVPLDANMFRAICLALRSHCQQTLENYKVPASWKQVSTIEMTVSGKVKRA
jgi:acyl-coenzyme A synthetase/AMP-(fatty) acid ligase